MGIRGTMGACVMVAAAAGQCLGQTTISPTNKFAWQENCGWLNWRDANGGAQGVRDARTYLTGFIWGENIGWINMGGTPANGVAFTNTASGPGVQPDFGVNIAGNGALSGFAWGENVGWINFGPFPGNPSVPVARFDQTVGRFFGFAWGENIGWVNLDVPSSQTGQFVSQLCYANCDGSTVAPVLNALDFSCFLNRFRAAESYANCDRSTVAPVLNALDFACFLTTFRAGCP